MATTAIERAASALPQLANTPALEIDAEDVKLPRLYIGQGTSTAVEDELVPRGSIYAALGADDPEPAVLWQPAKGNAKEKPGPVFYVLGMKKGKSVSEGGELVLFDYNDPAAPPEAWVTYKYFIAIPDHDVEVPYTWLLTRTGTPAAKQINMVLKRNAPRGPAWVNAFQVVTASRENDKGKWHVPRVTTVEATEAGMQAANDLAVMISGQTADVQATGDEPAI